MRHFVVVCTYACACVCAVVRWREADAESDNVRADMLLPHTTTGREGDCEKVSRAKKSTSHSCKGKLTKPAAEFKTGNHRSYWSICMWHRFFLGGETECDSNAFSHSLMCLSWVARQEQWKAIINGQDLGFFTIVFDCSIVRAFVIRYPGYAPPVFADSLYYMLVATLKGLLP